MSTISKSQLNTARLNGFDVNSLPHEIRESLGAVFERAIQGNVARNLELIDLAVLFEGGDAAFDDRYFPKPDGYDSITWLELKRRLLVLVNLVKATVRTMRTRVYGGSVIRFINNNPYQKEIEKFTSRSYSSDMRAWFNNRVLFSNAPACVLVKKTPKGTNKLNLWLPDPVFTYLIPDPDNCKDYYGVVEFSPDGKHCQFLTKNSVGRLVAGESAYIVGKDHVIPTGIQSYIQHTDFGFLPAVIGHAEDRRNRRNPYSVPAHRDSIKYTLRASDTLFNGGLLQKLQTKGILSISGNVDQQTMDFAEMMKQGMVFLDKDSKLVWAVPESRIGDTLELMNKLIETFSVVTAMPVSELNPTSSKGTSAEEAMRRSEPTDSMANEYRELSSIDEEELILKQTAMLEWASRGGPVDLDELQEKVETEIVLNQKLKPRNSQGDAQIVQMGYEQGALTEEDVAIAWNPHASPSKIKRIAENIRQKSKEKKSDIKLGVTNEVVEPGATEPK